MTTYDSNDVNQPGQAQGALGPMGLPNQAAGTGAPGSASGGGGRQDTTTEAGQYPARMPFTGTALSGGTGAPGTPGVGAHSQESGPDSVTFTLPTHVKASRDTEQGMPTTTYAAPVSGTSDWTTANAQSYGGADRFQMPGAAGNTPHAGEGQFQPGSGQVRRGGNVNGQRG